MTDNQDIDDIINLGKVPLTNRRPGYLDGPGEVFPPEPETDHKVHIAERPDLAPSILPIFLAACGGAFIGSVLTRMFGG